MKQYFIDRFKEPSTWRGVVLVITAFVTALTPEQKEAIIAIGVFLSGALGIATKD